MMEIVPGAAAGMVAATATEILHTDPSKKQAEDYLLELVSLMGDLCLYLQNQPQKHPDEHKTLLLFSGQAIPIRYDNNKHQFLTLHMLTSVACVLNVTIPGLPSFQMTFAAAPTAGQFPIGQYVRWRFPDSTTISLNTTLTPPQVYFPIELLYSDELGD